MHPIGYKTSLVQSIFRKEACFCLFVQIAFKRCVVAAKGIKDHFCAETEADKKGIEAAFAHQLSVSVAEIEEQRLVFAVQAFGQLFFQLVDVF